MLRSIWDAILWLRKKNQQDKIEIIEAINNSFKTAVEATAVSADILAPKTAYNGTTILTGTMVDNGAVEASIEDSGGSYVIPVGYHNGSGKVTGPTLASLIGENVSLNDGAMLLNGITAYGKNGVKHEGSMVDRRDTTVDAVAVTSDDTYTYFSTPAGCYSENSMIRTSNSNLPFEINSLYAEVMSGSHYYFANFMDLKKYNTLTIANITNSADVNGYLYFGPIENNNYIRLIDYVGAVIRTFDISEYSEIHFRIAGSNGSGRVYVGGIVFS